MFDWKSASGHKQVIGRRGTLNGMSGCNAEQVYEALVSKTAQQVVQDLILERKETREETPIYPSFHSRSGFPTLTQRRERGCLSLS